MPSYRVQIAVILLITSLGLSLCSLVRADEPQQHSDRVQLGDDLEVEELAPGIWRHIFQIPLATGPFPANGLVITSADGALVIDTPWTETQTVRLLDWVEKDLGLTVEGVVATHFHQDRLGGLAVVHRRGITSYGNVKTAELVDREAFEPPKELFRKRKTLRFGSRKIELFFPGAGHSPDNIVVWLPREKILYGGCLLKSGSSRGLGFLGDANLTHWPMAVRKVDRRYPKANLVVPGHQEPDGRKAIENTLRLLTQKTQDAQNVQN
ncbi:MAG: subclass B1 metallo-beta-lactamase [Deltaproteobacteria bacterium]|nr:subclass B1 metallo-beta-lactamase [Deltaproteobacteria bacterium]